MYSITKRFGPYSATHRHHLADTHCKFLHGYGREIEVELVCDKTDERNWVMDFGAFKTIRSWFDYHWDHKTLICETDPDLQTFKDLHEKGLIDLETYAERYMGIEGQAKLAFDVITKNLPEEDVKDRGLRVKRVAVYEHAGNCATYQSGE